MRADGKRLPACLPGQYLSLRLPGEDASARPGRRYSLAAWSPQPREYVLGIRRVEGGRVSGWLHAHARPGVELEVLPPAGDFVLRETGAEVVLVGGGVGLTPMAAMVDALLRKPDPRAWLFHAARHEAELIDSERYGDLDRAGHGFNYRPFLSLPPNHWQGGRGRITAADLIRELTTPATAHYFLCARQEMMDALREGLAALRVPAGHVHWESFGGTNNTDAGEYRIAEPFRSANLVLTIILIRERITPTTETKGLGAMYVCLCKSVTDREIRKMVRHDGVATMRQLRDACGVATQCGRCAQCAKTVLAEAVAECTACESAGCLAPA